jgi:hypothetical protein
MRARVSCPTLLITAFLVARTPPAFADGFLGIPRTIEGSPTNVGLLILGHSTSAQGAYPAKLATALNADPTGLDGRHYQVVNAITGGDGGFLWSVASVAASDARYHRVRASQGVGATPSPQWCEDATGIRWSCRRAKLDEVLTESFAIPSSGGCADVSVTNACRAPAQVGCTWYDRTLPPQQNPVTQQLSPHDCLARMDYRIALVQDTTNRSWPIDDSDVDGDLDGDDRWLSTRIRAEALPCGGGSGVVAGVVDWNCDGAADAADSSRDVYAGWLSSLAAALLATPAPVTIDFALFGHKPLEMGQCALYPQAERPACLDDPHTVRSAAEIAATPDRPFDHYYVPTVYWESAAIAELFARPGLAARILAATPGEPLAMWARSERCYVSGLGAADWAIAATVPGRPTDVVADDDEIDDGPAPDAATTGCMVADHIHHNDDGGWAMADVWFGGLLPRLATGIFEDDFESGGLETWDPGEARLREAVAISWAPAGAGRPGGGRAR